MSAVPPGLPSARAHTVQLVETSKGSWKIAPFVSVALASNTWKLPPDPGRVGARVVVGAVVVGAALVVVFAVPALVGPGLAVLASAGAAGDAPATYGGTAGMAQATTSDKIRPIAKASRPSP